MVNAAGIAQRQGRSDREVLNGIAHIDGDEFLLTGKNWRSMFRVRIAPAS
ncbi:MAG TPA: glutaminyl-peptide cyclotransferase [Mycobacterium sp.]|nr:glutaminyl-peptide cyclotransferase [Mycobacterium sp.]